jgi:hypothetical protein
MAWRGLLSLAQHMGCDVGWQIVPSAIVNPESPRLRASTGAGDEAAKRQRGVRRVAQALDDDRRLQGQHRGAIYADDEWGLSVNRGRLCRRARSIGLVVMSMPPRSGHRFRTVLVARIPLQCALPVPFRVRRWRQ